MASVPLVFTNSNCSARSKNKDNAVAVPGRPLAAGQEAHTFHVRIFLYSLFSTLATNLFQTFQTCQPLRSPVTTLTEPSAGSPISRQVSRGTDVPVRIFLILFSTLAANLFQSFQPFNRYAPFKALG